MIFWSPPKSCIISLVLPSVELWALLDSTLLLLLLSCPDTNDQELSRNPQAFSARTGLLKLAACELRWYWGFGLSNEQMALVGLPGPTV